MLSFLYAYEWAMPLILYSSCGILVSMIWTPDNISSFSVALKVRGHQKKNQVIS